MLTILILLACAPDEVETAGPLACEIVPADEDCPRRLLCCVDAATCWVETERETMDCTADSCSEALEGVCGG